MSATYKWVPIIATDYCTGCARCVSACEHDCLDMEWDFAKLVRPEMCGSEGACMEACPDDVIRMGWVEMEADQDVGEWTDSPPPQPLEVGWRDRLLRRFAG